MEHIRSLGIGEVHQIIRSDASSEERHSDDAVAATWTAMSERVPLVAQGALRDARSPTFGFPDLFVRSDVLAGLFSDALSAADASVPAPTLGLDDCHYVVVDIKFSTLELLVSGELSNSRSNLSHKVEAFVYNRALGALQGHLPPRAFLLGRGWEQSKLRGTSCMDRLALVVHDGKRGVALFGSELMPQRHGCVECAPKATHGKSCRSRQFPNCVPTRAARGRARNCVLPGRSLAARTPWNAIRRFLERVHAKTAGQSAGHSSIWGQNRRPMGWCAWVEAQGTVLR